MSVISAATLLTPDREVRPGSLEVGPDGCVHSISGVPSASSGTIVPGFVDLQCNGAAGASLADGTAESFDAVAAALLQTGTTAWCPTLPTARPDIYPRFLDTAAAAPERPGPRILGVHLEGPFLSPNRAGAHRPDLLRVPDPDWLEATLDRHPGLVRIVTLAPELPGALDLIELCVDRGVVVSLGHTDATAEQAEDAFDAGATMVTHLFNAMRPLRHRDPGVIGAAVARDGIHVGLIADGAHVDPRVAAFFARALGPRRTVLVSDSVDHPVPEPLRGGFELLSGAVANAVSWGIGFADAIRMASATAAEAVGEPALGRLEVGSPADCVRWDGGVRDVWIAGRHV